MDLMDENCIVKMELLLLIMIFRNTIKNGDYKLKLHYHEQVK